MSLASEEGEEMKRIVRPALWKNSMLKTRDAAKIVGTKSKDATATALVSTMLSGSGSRNPKQKFYPEIFPLSIIVRGPFDT